LHNRFHGGIKPPLECFRGGILRGCDGRDLLGQIVIFLRIGVVQPTLQGLPHDGGLFGRGGREGSG
jgi:hypothetical protein